MQVIDLEISNLRPYEKNARRHPQKQIDVLAKNIERFGFTTPVLVSEDNEVIAGHGRLLALKQLGRTEVPCVRMEGLTKEEIKALRLADNQIASMGEWDMGLVIEELRGLDEGMQELTGFDLDILKDLEEDDFDAQKEYIKADEEGVAIKEGDMFSLGLHRLICGDSTKIENYQKLFEGGVLARMVFTDPPYNVDYSYDWRSSLHKGKKVKHHFFSDKKTDKEYFEFLRDCFTNAYTFTEEDASYYCWYADKFHETVRKALEEAGWRFSQVIHWLKNYPVLSLGQNYHRTNEPCIHGWKKGKKPYINKRLTGSFRDVVNWEEFQAMMNVWYEERDKITSYKHPTQKPIKLAERAIRKSSENGDIVLEMFGGSGSTLIACEQMERKCYAIELDPIYCQVIINRYEQYTGTKAQKI